MPRYWESAQSAAFQRGLLFVLVFVLEPVDPQWFRVAFQLGVGHTPDGKLGTIFFLPH